MDIEVLIAQNKAQKAQIIALRHELDQLKRLIYGAKQERFVSTQAPEQLSLELDTETAAQSGVEATETITYQRRKKPHPGRTTLPENMLKRLSLNPKWIPPT